MRTFRHFIDGAFRDAASGQTFPDVCPLDGKPFAEVALGGAQDVDLAVRAARRAHRGPWGSMGAAERLDRLRLVADAVQRRFDDFLDAEIADTGKPAAEARRIDIPRGAANFRIFADLARGMGTDCFETHTEDGAGALNYAVRVPLGVVGVICPWNLPLLLMTWKVAPALAAGNTVVVKPSEETPATATLLAEVMAEAGIPPGVYNVVHGFGPEGAGEALVRHPGVNAITFTGESRTGQAIMAASAPTVKHLSFELGGKNPAIIFDDADFDAAVNGTVRSVFSNAGQVCLCSERVYVQRGLFDRFVSALAERAGSLRMGDPYDNAVGIGPLISRTHREKVLSYFAAARQEGATVVTGGGVPDLPAPYDAGYYVQPTIWTGLEESARCVREEIFGPVCHVRPFDEEEEAVALANDSEYGLAGAVWTRDLSRAHRVARQLEVGLAWVNCWYLRDLRTPFGGTKLSGVGREGGQYSMQFYSELRNVCVKL
ncbi:MAG: 2-hydroxymuconic semialdehyde dehydrogenase [Armatimonadetes bacterium]|nr:2-hydroxymuconic semialdehyde dehydrogenase [Armatimonadota bacterium]